MSRADVDAPIDTGMRPRKDTVCARKGISLSEANDMNWEQKISCVPILDENDN